MKQKKQQNWNFDVGRAIGLRLLLFKTIKMLTTKNTKNKLKKGKRENYFVVVVVPSFSLRFFASSFFLSFFFCTFLLCVNPFPGKNCIFFFYLTCSCAKRCTLFLSSFFFSVIHIYSFTISHKKKTLPQTCK